MLFFYNYGILRVQDFEMFGDGGNYGFIEFSRRYHIKSCAMIYHDAGFHGYAGALDSCYFVTDIKKCFYKTDFKIYPNPVTNELKFEFGLNSDRYLTAALYDMRGRKILDILNETKKPGEYVIDLSSKINSLSKGIYVFRYIDGSLFYNKKILKL